MASFEGFPSGRVRFTSIPAPFFTDLLPQIDDLGELKVTLYFFWRLDRMEGAFRYLRLEDFLDDAAFIAGMGESQENARTNLRAAVEKAVERGTLLKASVTLENREVALYFLNTLRGKAAVKAVRDGKWQPSSDPQMPVTLDLEKPNIFNLYETHIGPLTPMIAEALRDAEGEYPPEWVEEALRIAVENNVRKWRYVQAILERWQEEGRDARRDQKDAQEDRKKYIKGKFSDSVEH
jgi:DnaD/phage-associated family protein